MKSILATAAMFFAAACLFGTDLNSTAEVYKIDYYSIMVSDGIPGSTVNSPLSEYTQWDGTSFSGEGLLPGRIISLKAVFSLDESLKNQLLGIYIGPTPYACDIYVNGYQTFRSGQPGDNWISGGFLSNDFLLPDKVLIYGGDNNVLTVEISANGFTEPFPPVFISGQRTASGMAFKRNFFSVYLIRATSFTAVILSAYYLLLYFGSARTERRFLYFSLLCVAFFLSYMEISFASDSLSDLVIKKVSKIGFTLLLITLTTFVVEFTGLKRIKTPARLAVSIPGLVFIVILILNSTHRSVDSTLNLMLSYYFPVIILLNLGIVIYTAIKKPSPDNLVLLFAIIGAIVCALSDIFVILFSSIPYTYLTPYGFLLIILALLIVLTFDQLRNSKQTKEQAIILSQQNRKQQDMIHAITGLSETLQSTGNMLNDKIAESSKIIAENTEASSLMNNKIREQVSVIESTLPVIRKNLGESAEKIFSALTNQSAYADEVSETLASILNKMKDTRSIIDRTGSSAANLNSIAKENRSVIEESTRALNEIYSHSVTIQEVLRGIGDITSRTDLLAMNASIEAAHAGAAGKGFAVVAGEVRKLSNQSRKQITESNTKLEGMENAIRQSTDLSARVFEGLHAIIEEALRSSEMMNKTREEIELQQTNTKELLESVQSLIDDTVTIKDLSEENRNLNREVQQSLENSRTALLGFSELIDSQERQIAGLSDNILQIEKMFRENLDSIENLKQLLI